MSTICNKKLILHIVPNSSNSTEFLMYQEHNTQTVLLTRNNKHNHNIYAAKHKQHTETLDFVQHPTSKARLTLLSPGRHPVCHY